MSFQREFKSDKINQYSFHFHGIRNLYISEFLIYYFPDIKWNIYLKIL